MTASPLVDIDAEPALEHLLDIRIAFSAVHTFTTPVGMRATYVIAEGRCEGPRIRADVLPGGGDWVVLGADGVARLDVRATLRTDDGAHIHLTNTGRVSMSAVAAQRFSSGALLRYDEIYARSSPLFDTDDHRYRWLTGLHTVAINEVSRSAVHYKVFAVR
ncbi:hypothetical protein AU195_14995 [Mycobacterium sp. IS-1496]|uniref:DUF3237 domain-containing protein n=1 Tax=Mycobacterium sp. IS-1496 TaxID=1772284 RepID=UPI00074155E7|nr:DUF3237 domain-containing protein [Mycobacterium sp. IS-1496]KUI35598.1 hypothetical protein AU195_14995 [Mycobacterium sp. IS-1496]